MKELNRRLHHGIMKIQVQSCCKFVNCFDGWLAGKKPNWHTQRRAESDRLEKSGRRRHAHANIAHCKDVHESIKVGKFAAGRGKDDIQRNVAGALSRGRPSVRVAQEPLDLDPLESGRAVVQPSAQFLSAPYDDNERPVARTLLGISPQEDKMGCQLPATRARFR